MGKIGGIIFIPLKMQRNHKNNYKILWNILAANFAKCLISMTILLK